MNKNWLGVLRVAGIGALAIGIGAVMGDPLVYIFLLLNLLVIPAGAVFTLYRFSADKDDHLTKTKRIIVSIVGMCLNGVLSLAVAKKYHIVVFPSVGPPLL